MTSTAAAAAAPKQNGNNSPNDWIFDWPEDFGATPSRADGISLERELYERAQGVDLIVRVGSVRVSVPLLTVSTASIFLHRFYMMHSLAKYGHREVAMACLFLAGKVEESLRKVEAVVNYCLRLEDRRRGKEPKIHPSDPAFRKLVQQVLYIEELILVALQFDMTVVHPFKPLMAAIKHPALAATLPEESQRMILAKESWQVLNEMYTHPICISFSAPVLAVAAMMLGWNIVNSETVFKKQAFPQDRKALAQMFPAIDWTDEEEVGEIDHVVQVMCDWYAKANNAVYRSSLERVISMTRRSRFISSQ